MYAVRCRCGPASYCTFGGVTAGDAPEYQAPCETMLGESALRLAGAIETRNDLAIDVDHLGVGSGSQSGERVVQDRCRPPRIEGRRLDLVHWGRLLEVLVDTG